MRATPSRLGQGLGGVAREEKRCLFSYSPGSRGYGGLYGLEILCTLSGENSLPAPWQTVQVSVVSAPHGSAFGGEDTISLACAAA